MKKVFLRVTACFLAAAGIYVFSLFKNQESLQENLTRLHVVAASDREEDQQIKLKVRDAVLESLSEGLERMSDPQQAKAYLEAMVPKLQRLVNDTLKSLGVSDQAVVSFCREAFDVRHYESFSLPAGIYDSLKVVIGPGEGHNWWCVAYPQLCLGATTREVETMAAQAGIPDSARGAITGRYRLRFFLLDLLGRLRSES